MLICVCSVSCFCSSIDCENHAVSGSFKGIILISTDDFQAGLAEEVHRGHQLLAITRGVEKRKQMETYLRLLLGKAKRLSGNEAVKFKDEVLRPAAEEFAGLNDAIEDLRKELEEVP